jgi:transcriptional regulator with XRE-family HTH domain
MSGLGIKEIRKALGITAEQLGKEVGISSSYILRIESGNVQNPSFATISKLAEVIANIDAVKNSKVDLNKFDSDFAKLILSFRYSEIKEAYEFVRDNNNIQEYTDMVKYLSQADMNTITTLIEYRKQQYRLIEARNKLKETIMKDCKNRNYEEVLGVLKFNEVLNESLNFEMQEFLSNENKPDIDMLARILLLMGKEIEFYGVDNFIEVDIKYSECDLIDEEDDKEYINEPIEIEEENNHRLRRRK